MTTITSAEREQQRIEHLVHGRPRPRPAASRRMRRANQAGVVLAPGVEERVALREKWSHKQGTAETHEHYEVRSNRPGALARLWASGAITDAHLDAADRIGAIYWSIARDVTVRTASLETRIDGGRSGKAEGERLGAVAAEWAYGEWRRAIGAPGAALLEVIAHDVPLTIAASRHGIGMARARRLLVAALDLWLRSSRSSRREAKTLLAALPTP